MKRPEGFDRPATPPPAAAVTPRSRRTPPDTAGARTPAEPKPGREPRQGRRRPEAPASDPRRDAADRAADDARRAAREAQQAARRAAKERRRFERSEVRRFTRRSRNRRRAIIVASLIVATLLGLVALAVYSPLLSLETIEITGTSRVDAAEVHDIVDDQLGTPLALVDYDRITRQLSEFTLIRSYVTEAVPPHTLRIHVVEREPLGSIMTASGYTLVDPAGVEIESSETRPPGVPILQLGGSDADGPVFDSVVEVLLALPDPLLAQVDQVTATTMDDVTLVFAGVGQRVVWGSVDRSELKARVLEKLMAMQDAAALVEYDVTAPLSAVVRPG